MKRIHICMKINLLLLVLQVYVCNELLFSCVICDPNFLHRCVFIDELIYKYCS